MSNRTLDCIKAFRASIVDALKTANISGIGNNVFSARLERAWPEESAYICVYTPNTQFDDKRTSPRFYFAKGDLVIDIYARAASTESDDPSTIYDVNDFLDDTSRAVVEALQPVEKRIGPFNGLVKNLVLRSFSNNLGEKGEILRGCQRITFDVEYTTVVTTGVPTKDFLRANTTISVGPGSGNEQTFTTNVRPSNP